MSRSGAHALTESLLAQGLSTLFGIPGVGTLAVYDAFLDHPELRHIEVRHEQAAVFMADGFARASGDVGVAFTSGGPGSFNTVTAMATAFNDSSAVLHLVNENPAAVRRRGRGHFHDMSDHYGVFRSVTGFGIQVELADEIPAGVAQACFALRNRRPRPAMVEIAPEAFTQPTDVDIPARVVRRPTVASHDEVVFAVERIGAARRPLIWAGGGVATPGAAVRLLQLAERLGAAVITTQKGKGAMPSDHRLHVGNWANELPVRRMIDRTDLVIAVGTRFSYFPTGGWSLKIAPPIVQIDCDPTQIGRNYPVEVGIVGDAELSMAAILQQLPANEPVGDRSAEVAEALAAIRQGVGTSQETEMIAGLRAALPRHAMVFNDPTTIAFWGRSLWESWHPRTWFVPSGFGTLGSALPTAIGAKVARPDLPTVAILGDAGIMFTIQDLMTAVQERIPVVVLVFNDRGYGVERRHQDHLYGRRNAVDILPPDFVGVAEAFGARGLRVDDLDAVPDVVESVLDLEGPVLVEIPNAFGHPGYGAFGDYDKEQ